MTQVSLVNEIAIRIDHKHGALSHLFNQLTDVGIDVNGINLSVWANEGIVRLQTTQHLKAMSTLKELNYHFWEQEVVAFNAADHAGSTAKMTSRLAEENINILGMYASTGSGLNTTIYLWTNNNRAALNALS
ncbi:hypothetical protein BVY03_05715 [bacterium K02(2017)]|nr:hypothetical protein BVY03_05715 [bacterium K02(2017)]